MSQQISKSGNAVAIFLFQKPVEGLDYITVEKKSEDIKFGQKLQSNIS